MRTDWRGPERQGGSCGRTGEGEGAVAGAGGATGEEGGAGGERARGGAGADGNKRKQNQGKHLKEAKL